MIGLDALLSRDYVFELLGLNCAWISWWHYIWIIYLIMPFDLSNTIGIAWWEWCLIMMARQIMLWEMKPWGGTITRGNWWRNEGVDLRRYYYAGRGTGTSLRWYYYAGWGTGTNLRRYYYAGWDMGTNLRWSLFTRVEYGPEAVSLRESRGLMNQELRLCNGMQIYWIRYYEINLF